MPILVIGFGIGARPMGTFQHKTSMERILFAVFMRENRNQCLATPFALTHNS